MAHQFNSLPALLTRFEEERYRFRAALHIQIARLDNFDGTDNATGTHLQELTGQIRLIKGLSLQIADAFSRSAAVMGKSIDWYRDHLPYECGTWLVILPDLGKILQEKKDPRDPRRVSDRLKQYLRAMTF
jgi:hypothetical protein